MSKYFFSADFHLGHERIVSYANRPFERQFMTKAIINNHNSVVSEGDTVFHIGDFAFKYGDKEIINDYIKRLNGNIIFIRGNHDANNGVKTIIKSIVVKYGGYEMYLVHHPEDYESAFKVNLVGHVHNLWKYKFIEDVLLVNVGVDVWNYKPIEGMTLIKYIKKTIRKGV